MTASTARRPPAHRNFAVSLRRLFQVFRAHTRAIARYRVRSFAGRITLLQAAGRDAGSVGADERAWRRWARGGVDRHLIPGDHYTIVRQPHVRALAKRLRRCLETAPP